MPFFIPFGRSKSEMTSESLIELGKLKESIPFWKERAMGVYPEYTRMDDMDILRHGTLNLMIERALVDFQKAEASGTAVHPGCFGHDFLMTYGLCPPGTPEELLAKLVNEVFSGPPKGVMGKGEELEVAALPNTICAMLMYWYRLRPLEWDSAAMLEVWDSFVDRLEEKHAGRRKIPDCVHLFDHRLKTKGRDLNFNNIDVDTLAQQITVMEHRLFGHIDLIEFKGCAWMKARQGTDTEKLAPNILRAIEFFNNITLWVAAMILCQPDDDDRALMISRFIRLAKSLKQIRNYNSTMAVYMALTGVIVQRMKAAMALVDSYSLRTLETLKGFCEPENNYAIYRAEVAGLQGSDVYIPALGVVLKDVAAIVEAVPNVGDVGLFNGVKVAKLSRMLTPILRLRYLPTLPSEEWLINLVNVMLQPRYTYDELVKMSDRVRKGESVLEIQEAMHKAAREAVKTATETPASGAELPLIPYPIQLFLNMSSESVVIATADGVIKGYNKAAASVFGYEEAEVLEKHVEMLIPERLREMHGRHMAQLEDKASDMVWMHKERHVPALHKSGKELPITITLGRLDYTDGPSGAYVAFVRTTGHRLMTVESFHAMFDGSAFGVILMDTVGVIKVMNAKAEAITGFTDEESFGQNCTMLLPSAERERIAQVLVEAAAVKAADHPLFGTPEMVKFQRKDGSELVCRTVLNDVWMGAREKETSHLLLYIEECDPAAQAEIVKEVRQDNVSTYHEMQYLEQLMDMIDTAKVYVTVSKDTPNGVMKLVETIFEEYDSDHNGYICRKEYQDVATNFPFIGGFEQIDRDHDDKISKDELGNFLMASCYVTLILKTLAQGKARLSEEDFRALEKMLPNVNFNDVDVDNDGSIDVAELREYLLTNTHVLQK